MERTVWLSTFGILVGMTLLLLAIRPSLVGEMRRNVAIRSVVCSPEHAAYESRSSDGEWGAEGRRLVCYSDGMGRVGWWNEEPLRASVSLFRKRVDVEEIPVAVKLGIG